MIPSRNHKRTAKTRRNSPCTVACSGRPWIPRYSIMACTLGRGILLVVFGRPLDTDLIMRSVQQLARPKCC